MCEFGVCISLIFYSSCQISHLHAGYDTGWPTVISRSGVFPVINGTVHNVLSIDVFTGEGGTRGAKSPPSALPGKSSKFTPPPPQKKISIAPKSCKVLKIWSSKNNGLVAWTNEANVPERHCNDFFFKWVLISNCIFGEKK